MLALSVFYRFMLALSIFCLSLLFTVFFFLLPLHPVFVFFPIMLVVLSVFSLFLPFQIFNTLQSISVSTVSIFLFFPFICSTNQILLYFSLPILSPEFIFILFRPISFPIAQSFTLVFFIPTVFFIKVSKELTFIDFWPQKAWLLSFLLELKDQAEDPFPLFLQSFLDLSYSRAS